MDTSSFIAAFTPSKILIQTSVLPLISVDPTKKTWLGDFIDPKVYAVIGDTIIKLDPSAGKVALSSQAELDALPNNWGNVIALVIALGFLFAIVKSVIRK
jgi:glutamine cyclotransferase